MKKFLIILAFMTVASYQGFSQNLNDNNSEIILAYFNLSTSIENTDNSLSPNAQSGSEVVLSQTGNYNYAYINSGKNNKQKINQLGNRNNYEYYSYYNSNPTLVNTLQLGENNDIQIFGQNELTKNLNIIQNTNDKMIIIKNY